RKCLRQLGSDRPKNYSIQFLRICVYNDRSTLPPHFQKSNCWIDLNRWERATRERVACVSKAQALTLTTSQRLSITFFRGLNSSQLTHRIRRRFHRAHCKLSSSFKRSCAS